ncbi:MAG: GNAT family N-acetyltransferase, partial [Bacteroides sp.]|nr:GNAT family N-acetyltransferase [Bacteroides sp.]
MLTLLTSNDKTWLSLWQQSKDPEVFAHPACAALFEDGKTTARALYWEGGQGSVLYPFLLRDLRDEPFWKPEIGEAYDMVTPYGYGGPVVVSGKAGQDLFRDFYAALGQWAVENRVITEFVRFSLFSEAPKAYYGEVVHHNDNIVVDLSLSHDALWQGFRHKVRKNIHTAQAAGITIETDPTGSRLDDFLAVYHHTLDRRQAAPQYYLQRPFFEKLQHTLPGHCCYFHALHQGQVIASELVLLSAARLYSYLGGTFCESFPLRPGDLLKYHIMQWAREKGH